MFMRLGMQSVKGIPVSPGIVMGRAIVLGNAETHVPRREIAQPDLEREVDRLDTALREAVEELGVLRDRTAVQIGSDAAKIFGFHLGLLQDPTLLTPMRERIRNDRVNAEVAVADAFQKLADQFRALGSEMFSQKANDVLDLDRRVLAKLMGEDENRLATLTEPTIVIAHELTPSQTAGMDRTLVIGIATDLGGRTSHTSIVARAIEIPCVVGCSRVMGRVADGDMIIIDGDTGVVIVRPDARTLAEYTIQQERFSVYRSMLRNTALLEPVTKDGTRIQLLGNIEFPHEVESVFANGGEGVGLYRTEFLFLTSDHEPTEEEQFAAYKQTVELLKGRPLTIRTLDLGADKYTQNRATEPERNPFLGLRSIRYCLQHKALFKTQLRAILRASAFGPMKVMFPLVSTVMELRQARLILNDVAEELAEEGIRYDQNIPIGIMVETPSAALMANAFAKEVSFFSIGTNDLIQYTLAVDRGNERVAHLYSGASPAVLYLVKTVVRTARRSGIDCSLCGEVAGEAIYTMLLIGLGLRTLSLVPSQIPLIKRVIRSTTVENCEELARRVGSFDSERQVLNTLRDELRKVDPGSFAGWIAE
ncbi:MAG: phosphoenolpyruvate--protein phosphotransferase [Planctomycetota bacterium]|nr:MAG: phosphoenolpyruvate--protein phosphotransferase [Planctomycetota bacterium]